MSAPLPDPVEYAADALGAAGALLERDAEGWLALLPDRLARELGAAEVVRLASHAAGAAGDDRLVCGIGAPALERLTGLLEGRGAMAAVELGAEPPRASQARTLAERYALRNAPSEVGELSAGCATYLVAWMAWSAEADDRYDGVVQTAVCVEDLGAPDAGLLALADPLRDGSRFEPARAASEPAALRLALATAAARAQRGLAAPLVGVRELVARRLRRDHERIADYFEQLARDARAPRRKVDAEAIAAKLAHLHAERDAKLRALAERYRLRVRLEPLALLLAGAPTLRVRLRVRRRKLEGSLWLRLAPGAERFDQLACSACTGATARPLVCDDRLHVLCESCAPSAQGRPSCAACRRPAGCAGVGA